jgi:hypothetical protein
MAGRFEGVSDLEWRLFEDIFPQAPSKRGRGMPHAPFRKILNTLLYISPFAQSTPHILNCKLPVEINPQAQSSQDVLL